MKDGEVVNLCPASRFGVRHLGRSTIGRFASWIWLMINANSGDETKNRDKTAIIYLFFHLSSIYRLSFMFTWSQLRSGLRWQSQAQGFPWSVNECNFATLSTVLCFNWKLINWIKYLFLTVLCFNWKSIN